MHLIKSPNHEPNHWGAFVAGLLAQSNSFTVTIDPPVHGKLQASSDTVFVLWVAEETLEMFIPLLFIAAYPRRAVAPEQQTQKVAA